MAATEATPSEDGTASVQPSPREPSFSPAQLEEAQQSVTQLKSDLEAKIAVIERLEGELVEKVNSFENLKKKLKDQDDMREEIETLRQDLLDFGLEHTEAKDKV